MKASIACLVLLVSAVGTSAFYLDGVVQEALMEVQSGMASGFEAPADKLSRADKLMPFLGGSDGNGECCNCTKGSAKWVMDHVISAIKKKCAETECEKLKKMCEKAGEHPEVTFGYLIGAVRPVSLGYAWCNGKGVCGKKAEEEELTSEEAINLSQSMEALLKKADEQEDIVEATEEDDILLEVDAEEAGGEMRCRKCLKGVSKAFMWKTIGKIKRVCKTTESPVLQKMCMAAKKHPKVAFGYIFYKLRPVEFAAGFCIAKGPCGHKKGGCSQYHDELVFDLMQDDKMSLDDGAEDAAIFY